MLDDHEVRYFFTNLYVEHLEMCLNGGTKRIKVLLSFLSYKTKDYRKRCVNMLGDHEM